MKNSIFQTKRKTNTVGPKTGLVNHAGMYAGIGLGIVAVAAIAVFVMRRKKK